MKKKLDEFVRLVHVFFPPWPIPTAVYLLFPVHDDVGGHDVSVKLLTGPMLVTLLSKIDWSDVMELSP